MSNTGFTLQLAITDVTTEKMAQFWPESVSAWFAILEAQFRLHRIHRQDLRYAILDQWLTEEITVDVSDVIIGTPSETPYDFWKNATLRQSQPEKAGLGALLQQSADLRGPAALNS